MAFQEIPREFNEELISAIKKIQNESLRSIYENLQIKYFDVQTCQNESNFKTLISNALSNFKFIVYDICQLNSDSEVSNLNICVEDYLIIIESINTNQIDEILQNSNNSIINANNPKNKDGDIEQFCLSFYSKNTQNKIIKSIFKSVSSYLINRYFYPTHYFKNPSFFNYKNEQKNYSTQIKAKVTQILQSNDDKNINGLICELNNEIKTKLNENEENLPIYDFNLEDFIKLHELSTNSKYDFVIEKQTLYIFVMKEVLPKSKEVRFCKKYRHQNFLRPYGFIKDKNKNITHVIYEYMSNSNLNDFVKGNKNQIDESYSLLTAYRIFEGIEYLKSKSRIHRDLKPQNVLINHDYIPFISDFELIKKINNKHDDDDDFTAIVGYSLYQSPELIKNKNISFESDIFSFGLLVYFLFEGHHMVKNTTFQDELLGNEFKNKNEMKNGRQNIQQIYSLSVIHNQEERIKHDEIRTKLLNEYKSYYYLDKYFIEEYEKEMYSIIGQLICDITKILNQNELKIFINRIQDFFLLKLNLNKIDKKQSMLIIIGDKYYKIQYYSKAFEFYELSAQLNNSDGHLYLADLYYNGHYVRKDYLKAIEHYEKSASQGNAISLFNLGNMYAYGIGVGKDYKKAIEYYEPAVELNMMKAATEIGRIYYEGSYGVKKDYSKALFYFQKVVDHEDPIALLFLGSIYCDGLGVEIDYLKGINYYERSAKLGNRNASVELGNIYLEGKGVTQSYEKAREYFENAADESKTACYNLGYMHFYGLGVKQSYKIAYEYFQKSSDSMKESFYYLGLMHFYGYGVQKNYSIARSYFNLIAFNHSLASTFLGIIYQNGYGLQAPDYQKAFSCYIRATSLSNVPEAWLFLGEMIYNGYGVEVNYEKAFECLSKAANQKCPQALHNLGILCFRGHGIEKSYSKAKKYFESAAELDYKPSFLWLGNVYYYVEQNYKKAFEYYNKSIDNDFPDGYLNLGACYFHGNGVKQDYNKAFECFQKSLKSQVQDLQVTHTFLGYSYLFGYGVKKDVVKAVEHYKYAVKYNNHYAQYQLGIVYLRGFGYERNFKEAKKYFELSAKQNDPNAFNGLGDIYLHGFGVKTDFKKALNYYEKAVSLNCSTALFPIGLIYLFGFGVEQDFNKANEYFERIKKLNNEIDLKINVYLCLGDYYNYCKFNFSEAKKYYELAKQFNSPHAYYRLAGLYFHGYGVVKEYEKSLFYYKKAAELNYWTAYYNIGFHYLKGFGVNKDVEKAKEYFDKGIMRNDPFSLMNLSILYYHGDGVEQNYDLARKYAEQSASFYNSDAYLFLSYFYYYGNGVQQNILIYKGYLELSAQLNNCLALFLLGELYSNNEKVGINIDKAIQYFTKCSQISFQKEIQIVDRSELFSFVYRVNNYCYPACNNLGLIYLFDRIDLDKAFNYINESGLNEFPFGQNNLGLFYMLYVNNIEKATHFYERSSQNNFSLAFFNLGNLKENENKIDESIEFYIKASENEDKPLIFRDITFTDVRLNVSKTFIICFTNLKLCLHYLLHSKYEKSKEYFIKSFSKLKIDDDKTKYLFNFQFKFQSKNRFSYIKNFIFNCPLFNLNNQPNMNLNLNFNEDSSSFLNHFDTKSDSYEKITGIINYADLNELLFNNPGDLFDFVVQNENMKIDFIEEIKEIIEIMKSILYNPPYNILFGRINLLVVKSDKINKSSINNITKSFYDGFGWELLK